jgi:hypothetical protein
MIGAAREGRLLAGEKASIIGMSDTPHSVTPYPIRKRVKYCQKTNDTDAKSINTRVLSFRISRRER